MANHFRVEMLVNSTDSRTEDQLANFIKGMFGATPGVYIHAGPVVYEARH